MDPRAYVEGIVGVGYFLQVGQLDDTRLQRGLSDGPGFASDSLQEKW